MNRKKFFRKPTGAAVAAGLIGVLLHLCVFFLFRIGVAEPLPSVAEEPRLSFAGTLSAENSAFLDPLTLLLSDQGSSLPRRIRDFREISISGEISPHPATLLLNEREDWSNWFPGPSSSVNPGTWILGQTVNPLRDYARDPQLGPPMNSLKMTLWIENLYNGATQSVTLPIPPELLEVYLEANPSNPPVFLFDRSDRFSNTATLPVSSSGDVSLDRAASRVLTEGLVDDATRNEYYRITFFFPRQANNGNPTEE